MLKFCDIHKIFLFFAISFSCFKEPLPFPPCPCGSPRQSPPSRLCYEPPPTCLIFDCDFLPVCGKPATDRVTDPLGRSRCHSPFAHRCRGGYAVHSPLAMELCWALKGGVASCPPPPPLSLQGAAVFPLGRHTATDMALGLVDLQDLFYLPVKAVVDVK